MDTDENRTQMLMMQSITRTTQRKPKQTRATKELDMTAAQLFQHVS
jgi:hypothetical protein